MPFPLGTEDEQFSRMHKLLWLLHKPDSLGVHHRTAINIFNILKS
jgi:hypothetical protein